MTECRRANKLRWGATSKAMLPFPLGAQPPHTSTEERNAPPPRARLGCLLGLSSLHGHNNFERSRLQKRHCHSRNTMGVPVRTPTCSCGCLSRCYRDCTPSTAQASQISLGSRRDDGCRPCFWRKDSLFLTQGRPHNKDTFDFRRAATPSPSGRGQMPHTPVTPACPPGTSITTMGRTRRDEQ